MNPRVTRGVGKRPATKNESSEMTFVMRAKIKFSRLTCAARAIRTRARFAVLTSLFLIVATSTRARAQTAQLAEEEREEREFTNPLTTLPQLLIRDSYSP